MNLVELVKKEHHYTMGQEPSDMHPNIKDDTIFVEDGKLIGFYIKQVPDKLSKLLKIANNEFASKRVPKTNNTRGTKKQAEAKGQQWVEQYSTIIGAVQPKVHFRRPYKSFAAIHKDKKASTFIKAMLLAGKEGTELIKLYTPEIYEAHRGAVENVDDKWRLTDLFTSSISNNNISAKYHTDNANIKNTINIIFTKRRHTEGGCLHVPDYGCCIEQADESMLVYPAWRNLHGVTPIKQKSPDGYRNSLVFYALKGFEREDSAEH